MTTIADDLRAAAANHDGIADEFATRLRQHADTIERVEREMRIKYSIDRYYPARGWANALMEPKR